MAVLSLRATIRCDKRGRAQLKELMRGFQCCSGRAGYKRSEFREQLAEWYDFDPVLRGLTASCPPCRIPLM
jgi:hypothetical protein